MNAIVKWTTFTLILLMAWQALLTFLGIPRYILPKPSEIAVFSANNAKLLSIDLGYTAIESILGFLISIAVSFGVAIWIHFIPRSERAFSLVTVCFQSIPVLALAPFLTSWFGPGIGSKIAASAVVCIFPLIGGWMAGRSSITENEHIFCNSVLPSARSRFFYFILPRSLPGFFAALRVGCPLCVLGALVGEFVGARHGLGFRILTGSYYLRTEEMACGIVLACMLSLSLYFFVAIAEQRLLFWYGKNAR